MKLFKRIKQSIIQSGKNILKIIICAFGIVIIFSNLSFTKTQPAQQEQLMQQEQSVRQEQLIQQEISIKQQVNDKNIDLLKQQLKQQNEINKEAQRKKNVKQANLFINTIHSSDTQLVCNTISGEYQSDYQRKSEDDFIFFNNASIHMVNSYISKIGIYTSDLTFSSDEQGNVTITYSKDNLQILSTEITNTTYSDGKDLFGKDYSKQELVAIIENNTDAIKQQILSNQDYILQAEESLQDYYINLAKSMNVKSITFNNNEKTSTYITLPNPSYTYKDCTTVKYGHANKKLNAEDVKYIILHGTGATAINVSAENHIAWLNNDNAKDQCATHFYVDEDSINQALPLDIISWNAGQNYNDKSISIEICTFDDEEKQLQAMSNAKELLDNLRVKFPNAEIVSHKQVSSWGKACPSFIYDSNTSIMTEEEFFNTMLK